MTNSNGRLPIGFRASPCGQVVQFNPRQKQYRKLAAAFHRWRAEGRDILSLEVILETGIQEWQARRTELKDKGLVIEAYPFPNAGKGDQREVYRLAANIELVWEAAEDGHDLDS